MSGTLVEVAAPRAKRRAGGRPFPKGNSANPGGRPKELVELKAAAREHTMEAIGRLVFWMRSNEPKASVAATNALLDRAYGKPPQALDVDLRLSVELAARLQTARLRDAG